MWWMLAREVLRLRGTISRDLLWDVMPDLYFFREPEEVSSLEPHYIVSKCILHTEYHALCA